MFLLDLILPSKEERVIKRITNIQKLKEQIDKGYQPSVEDKIEELEVAMVNKYIDDIAKKIGK